MHRPYSVSGEMEPLRALQVFVPARIVSVPVSLEQNFEGTYLVK